MKNQFAKCIPVAKAQTDAYGWLDLLGRLENELANREEAWRTRQDDPHNIATAVYVAIAEVRASINTAIAEAVSRSNVRVSHSERATGANES